MLKVNVLQGRGFSAAGLSYMQGTEGNDPFSVVISSCKVLCLQPVLSFSRSKTIFITIDLSTQDTTLDTGKTVWNYKVTVVCWKSDSIIQWSHLALIFMDSWDLFFFFFFLQISNFIASINIQLNYFQLLRFQTH